eukprot:1174058-Amphidinium_carterae.1
MIVSVSAGSILAPSTNSCRDKPVDACQDSRQLDAALQMGHYCVPIHLRLASGATTTVRGEAKV